MNIKWASPINSLQAAKRIVATEAFERDKNRLNQKQAARHLL